MSMVAYYDVHGRYVWTGNPTVVVEGAPPPPRNSWEVGNSRYDGAADAATQYHDPITNLPAEMGARPSMAHVFEFRSKTWRDPRSLTQLRDAQWAEVRAARDAQDSSYFPYMGKWINSNLVSVIRINTIAKAAEHALANQGQFAIAWTCADNSVLALDAEGMVGMPLALAAYSAQLHAKGAALRGRIYTETDAVRLAEIKWNADV